jgi:internalin A
MPWGQVMTDTQAPELLLKDLRERIASGRVVAIVGAGVAIAASGGNRIAGWKGLLEDGINRCEQVVPGLPPGWGQLVRKELESGDIDDLLSAAQKVEAKLLRVGELGKWLIDTVGNLQVREGATIDALCALQIPIMTTNYDGLIEKQAGLTPVTWKEPAKYDRVLQGDRAGVLHLHGFYEDVESVVLGVRSYERVLRDDFAQAMQRAVRSLYTLLFIGYGKGLDDPNFSALLAWARKVFADSTYRHYRLSLAKDVASLQGEHDPKDRVFVIPYGQEYADLVPFLNSLVAEKQPAGSDTKGGSELPVTPDASAAVMPVANDLQAYLAAVRLAHGYIKFVEIPLYEDTLDIEIDKMYVESSVSRERILPDRPENEWPPFSDLGTLLLERSKIVVLGDPGYGKSTLTSCLSWQLCKAGSEIPIPMVVRELHLKADICWEALLDSFLQHRIGKLLGSRSVIEALLREGRAVVFLDGLDEIGTLVVRKKLRDAVHDGMSLYPGVKWVLTSRVVGYDQVPFHVATANGGKGINSAHSKNSTVAEVYYLAPFSSSQISEFANKWYQRHESDAKLAPERAAAFVNAINENAGTKRLARVPYLLTLMALIHRKAASLPHGRTDLYDRISTAYLESIDVRRDLDQVPYSLAQKKRWLAEAGYQMQLRRTGSKTGPAAEQADILVTEKELCEWLTKAMKESGVENPAQEARPILSYFASRSGLLVPRGEGLFAFMHLSQQEYFTASYLEPRLTASRFSKSKKAVPTDKQLHKWANQNEWLEVYVLLFELLAKKDSTNTEEFFNFLFGERFTFDGADKQAVAARLLAELVVDPFVFLSAGSRRRGRNMCWRWEFRHVPEPDGGRLGFSDISAIAQMLVAEHKGDLRAAWQAAGLTMKDLQASATYLNLAGCTGVADLHPLSKLSQLNILSLAGCAKLVDLSALSNLKKLVGLDLDRCPELNDLSPLGKLKELESLSLSGCAKVHSINPLAGLKQLKRLELPACGSFDSLLPVASLMNLSLLSIDYLAAPLNFAHLKKCISLGQLIIGGSSTAQDLSPLAQHPKLKTVHFHAFPPDIDLTPFLQNATIETICLAGTEPKVIPDELVQRDVLNPHRRARQRPT